MEERKNVGKQSTLLTSDCFRRHLTQFLVSVSIGNQHLLPGNQTVYVN